MFFFCLAFLFRFHIEKIWVRSYNLCSPRHRYCCCCLLQCLPQVIDSCIQPTIGQPKGICTIVSQPQAYFNIDTGSGCVVMVLYENRTPNWVKSRVRVKLTVKLVGLVFLGRNCQRCYKKVHEGEAIKNREHVKHRHIRINWTGGSIAVFAGRRKIHKMGWCK